MKLSKIPKGAWVLLLIAVFAILIPVFFKNLDYELLKKTVTGFKATDLMIMYGMVLIILFLEVFQRKWLLNSLQQKVRFKNLVLIHFASASTNYSAPVKLGYPLIAFLLKKLENVQYPATTAMISVGLMFSLINSAIIAFTGFFVYDLLDHFKVDTGQFWVVGLVAFLIVILIFLRKKLGKLRGFIKATVDNIRVVKPANLVVYEAIRITMLLAVSAQFTFLINLSGGNITIFQAIFVMSCSFILGALSMVPMGLGVTELSTMGILVMFGVTEEIALAVALLQRAIVTGTTMILGLLSSMFLGLAKHVESGEMDEAVQVTNTP